MQRVTNDKNAYMARISMSEYNAIRLATLNREKAVFRDSNNLYMCHETHFLFEIYNSEEFTKKIYRNGKFSEEFMNLKEPKSYDKGG